MAARSPCEINHVMGHAFNQLILINVRDVSDGIFRQIPFLMERRIAKMIKSVRNDVGSVALMLSYSFLRSTIFCQVYALV